MFDVREIFELVFYVIDVRSQKMINQNTQLNNYLFRVKLTPNQRISELGEPWFKTHEFEGHFVRIRLKL